MKSMRFFMKLASNPKFLAQAVAKTKTERHGVDDVIKEIPPDQRDDYLAKLRQEKKAAQKTQFNHNFVEWLLSDPNSGYEKKAAEAPNNKAVKSFLLKNPNPTDAEVHRWAEQNGWDRDHTERVFYRMAADHAKMGHV